MAGAPPPKISKRAEEGLRYKQKQYALRQCRPLAEDFVECSKDKLISVVWRCRDKADALNACLHQHTNSDAFKRLKHVWMDAGQPENPDWEKLLKQAAL